MGATLDASLCNRDWLAWMGETLPRLTGLRLEGNNITELPANAFRSFAALKTLSLQDNRISVLPPQLFAQNHQLTTVLKTKEIKEEKIKRRKKIEIRAFASVPFFISLNQMFFLSFILYVKLFLGMNPLMKVIPSGFLAKNPNVGNVILDDTGVAEIGREWLRPSNSPRASFMATLSMSGSPSQCTTAGEILTCSCAPGYVGGASGFCVRPCSETLEHAPSGLAPMNASACPGFQLPQDLWPGGRPCVLNATVDE
jgi:hypothetical protein